MLCFLLLSTTAPHTPSGRLHLKRVCCGNISSGRTTSSYRWLCLGRETLAQPTQASRRTVASSVPKTGFTRTTDLRVTCDCLKLVVRHSCEQQHILKVIMVSSWLCVTLTSDARVLHNQHNPVNQSWSPIGHGENCEAYRKPLDDPQPRIFGCTNSIKPQKHGKPTCDARTSVSLLTPIFFLSFSGRQEVLYGMWPIIKLHQVGCV